MTATLRTRDLPSCVSSATGGAPQSPEPSSPRPFPRTAGLPPGSAPADPYAFARQFPDRWMAFLHAHYRDPVHVAYELGVTEKGAQKWWHGVGGPKGDLVALRAARQHPEGAVVYLFGGAA